MKKELPLFSFAERKIPQNTDNQKHHNAIREAGKADRSALVSAISDFVQYVGPNGSRSARPDLAYSNFTRMIYAPFGLNRLQIRAKRAGVLARDTFSELQLAYLQVTERTVAAILRTGMKQRRGRKEIKIQVRDAARKLAGLMREMPFDAEC